MSTSKQVVEKAFDCFNKGDIEGITALCTEDTRWEVVGNAPWCGVHTGKQAVANDFFGKLATYLEATGKVSRLLAAQLIIKYAGLRIVL